MSTIPALDSDAFYITVPEGWSMVDIRRLLAGSLFDVISTALGDVVIAADVTLVEHRLSTLRRQIDDENLVLMALRAHNKGGALQVLTIACPDPNLARETQDIASRNSHLGSAESPIQIIQLPNGADAVVHRGDGTDAQEARWTSVQLVMRISGTKVTVILTLLSSDGRDLDILTTEATALAQSISRRTADGEATENALS